MYKVTYLGPADSGVVPTDRSLSTVRWKAEAEVEQFLLTNDEGYDHAEIWRAATDWRSYAYVEGVIRRVVWER